MNGGRELAAAGLLGSAGLAAGAGTGVTTETDRARRAPAAALVIALAALLAAPTVADARTYEVKNTHARGKGSLVKAVKKANRHRGRDKIRFKRRLDGKIRIRRLLEVTDPLRIIGNGARDDLKLTGKRDGSRIEFQSGKPKRSRVARLRLERVGLRVDSTGARDGSLQVLGAVLEGENASTSSGIEVPRGRLKMKRTDVGGFLNDGVRVIDGQAEVLRSTIAGNANDGVSAYHGTVELEMSTASGNRGFGAHSDLESIIRITNSTISGNGDRSRVASGGLIASGGSISVQSSTIAENRFAPAGSLGETGAALNGTFGGAIVLQNVIVADNRGLNCGPGAEIARDGGNVFDDATGCGPAGPGDVVADPGLGPLARNGGPTRTQAIGPRSPAVGAAVPGGPAEDQRGVARDPDPDSGAFELRTPQR